MVTPFSVTLTPFVSGVIYFISPLLLYSLCDQFASISSSVFSTFGFDSAFLSSSAAAFSSSSIFASTRHHSHES